MALNTEENRVQYDGDNSSTDFPVPLYFFENIWINAIQTDANGSDTVLIEGIDYNLSGALIEAGGELILTNALPNGERLTIYREAPYNQQTTYEFNGAFPSDANEDTVDKNTILIQQVRELAEKLAITYPQSEPIDTNSELPDVNTRKGNFLYFLDTDGSVGVATPTNAVLINDDTLGAPAPSSVNGATQASILNHFNNNTNPALNPSAVIRTDAVTPQGNIPAWGANDGELTAGYTFTNDPSSIQGLTPSATQIVSEQVIASVLSIIDPIGIPKPFLGTTPPTRHLLYNGETFGNNNSGADNIESATGYSHLALFSWIFDNLSDANAPILDSAGAATTRASFADAATAYNADSRMTLPDFSGYTARALDATLTEIGEREGSNTFTFERSQLPTIDVAVSGGGSHNHPFTAVLTSTANASADGVTDNEAGNPAVGLTGPGGSGVSYNVINPAQGSTSQPITHRTPSFGCNWMARL